MPSYQELQQRRGGPLSGQRPLLQRRQARQMAPPPPSEKLGQILSKLSQGYQQLDQPGQAQVNELTERVESLRKSKDRLRPQEFEQAMGSLHRKLVEYPWDQHVRPKGSNPGDIIEDEGVRKVRRPDGTLEPIAYTADYVNRNTTPIGDTGQVLVPVSPNEPAKIVSAKDRDLAGEQGQIDRAQKGIQQSYDEMVKTLNADPNRQVELEDGSTVPLPISPREQEAMYIAAGDDYIKRQVQAKHAAQRIADTGAPPTGRAFGGDVPDPFKMDVKERAERERRVLEGIGRRDAARELKKELGDRDQMQGSGGTDVITGNQTASPEDAQAAINVALSGGDTKRTKEEKQIDAATVPPSPDFTDKLVSGGMMDKPLIAESKKAMNERYKDLHDGVVVELPDGRRYIKDDGKFWQVPWNKDQLSSPVMLDAEGNTIKDPSTGKPAVGIVKQLEEGKSQGFSPVLTGTPEGEQPVMTGPMPSPETFAVQQERLRNKQPVPQPTGTAQRGDEIADVPAPGLGRIKTPDDAAPKAAETAAPPRETADDPDSKSQRTKLSDLMKDRTFQRQVEAAQPLGKRDPNQMPVGLPFYHNGMLIFRRSDGEFEAFSAAAVQEFSTQIGSPGARRTRFDPSRPTLPNFTR